MSAVTFVASSSMQPQQLQPVAPLALRGRSNLDSYADKAPAAAGGASSAPKLIAATSAGLVAVGTFVGKSRARAGTLKRASGDLRAFDKTAQIGAMAPLGFFDPLGFCKDEESFRDLRTKELKHGRLAMMGAAGMLAQSLWQLPSMEGVPTDVSAAWTGNGATGMAIALAIIALLEAAVFVQDDKREPGDFGNPLPLVGNDYSDDMRNKELNNGRFAMFSAAGLILASLYTGRDALEQFAP